MMSKTLNIWWGLKCRVIKMYSKLRDHQLKKNHTHIYIYGLLYINFMVTTNQKSIIDAHTQKK